jgi:hypothetical protein
MSEQEENLRTVLADAQRRHIAEFCFVPHSSDEIFKSVKSVWSGYTGDTLASDLKALESIKAVAYTTDDKWTTTEPAKKILKKYFGIK